MKVKTSITLSPQLLKEIRKTKDGSSVSEFLETAAWEHIHRQQKRTPKAADEVKLYDRFAPEMNKEAEDLLEFQTIP